MSNRVTWLVLAWQLTSTSAPLTAPPAGLAQGSSLIADGLQRVAALERRSTNAQVEQQKTDSTGGLAGRPACCHIVSGACTSLHYMECALSWNVALLWEPDVAITP